MSDTNEKRIEKAVGLYSPLFLAAYDWLALGFNCRFVWQCPSAHMLELYNRFVSPNHLDIGVGTGYFMDHCNFPVTKPRIALMDLNVNSLNFASRRLSRYNPEVYQRNALVPFDIDVPKFDSIAMINLLHCLPGNMDTKATVFENVKAVMNPGAVVFGSTILSNSTRRNPLATLILKVDNRMGILTNLDDTIDDLEENLSRHFSDSSVQVIGYIALFRAHN